MLEIVDNSSSPALLKVIGVGGGGSNAVNRMIQSGLRDVEFWVSNTDQQALERSHCHNRIQIGHDTTKGLGAGGDPEIGRISAEEDIAAIEAFVAGADMVFITAGMGGGTGTGAAPVIARIAREQGILTVAIVTRPFAFEGKKRLGRARRGLESLSEHVDTLITIPNQKLMEIVEPGTSFDDALLMADEVLFQATRGISDLIMGHGIINLDFADVRTVMRSRGNALLGSGSGSGERRAVDAARAAVSSPLLEDLSISGAEALLVNIQGGPGMGFHEAAEAAQFIADQVGEEADVFWGAVVDPTLEEEMRVTLVATGFPELANSVEVTRTDSSKSSAAADPVLGNVPASATTPSESPLAAQLSAAEPDASELELAETGTLRLPGVDSVPANGAGAVGAESEYAENGSSGDFDPAEDDDPVLTLDLEARRRSVRRRRVEPIHVVEEARVEEQPVLSGAEDTRTDRPLRRPPVIGSAVGKGGDSGGVSAPRPSRRNHPPSVESVPAQTIGYREPPRGEGRAPERRRESVGRSEQPAVRREPVRRAEPTAQRRPETTHSEVLHGADPGLSHARLSQEESDDRTGKQRSGRRNPLDVPTFLRKRMDD
jgi:cell division protein FtsZ